MHNIVNKRTLFFQYVSWHSPWHNMKYRLHAFNVKNLCDKPRYWKTASLLLLKLRWLDSGQRESSESGLVFVWGGWTSKIGCIVKRKKDLKYNDKVQKYMVVIYLIALLLMSSQWWVLLWLLCFSNFIVAHVNVVVNDAKYRIEKNSKLNKN